MDPGHINLVRGHINPGSFKSVKVVQPSTIGVSIGSLQKILKYIITLVLPMLIILSDAVEIVTQ